MSKEIDWSKAPEGYPVWIQDLTGTKPDGSGWHREETAAYNDEPCERWTDVDGRFWPKDCEARGRISVHRKPVEVWTGTGLPPVGTVCEVEVFHVCRGEWTVVEVLAHAKHDEDDALLVCEIDHDGDRADMHGIIYRPHYFRHIRTPEQIALEEREKAVDEIVAVWKKTMGRFAEEERGLAKMLYDHGYRKTEAGK